MKYKDTIYKNFGFGDEFKNHFHSLVSAMMSVSSLLEHCHRETKSEPRHTALGYCYESIADIKDKITEQIIGISGMNYGGITSGDIPEYSPDMAEYIADLGLQVGKSIEDFGKIYNMCSVENLGAEYYEQFGKLKYKLQLDNSDEGAQRQKAMNAGGITGAQTWNRTDTSAASVKKEDLEGGLKYIRKNYEPAIMTPMDTDWKLYNTNIKKHFPEIRKAESAQQAKVHKVMKEFKEGSLTDPHGNPITDRKRAIAIAMKESGQSYQ